MSKVRITREKRYEIEQIVDLANMLKPGTDWPAPEKLDELDAKIARLDREGHAYDEVEEQREKALAPVWKAATKRFPPRAGDPGIGDARDHRGALVVLRKPGSVFSFHFEDAVYRAAYVCRAVLTNVAAAAVTRPKLPVPLDLPPAQPRFQVLADGRINRGPDFYRDFVLDALEDVDATLIRICKACGRLFLAKRVDQSGCGTACANLARQAKFRADPKHKGYHKRYYRQARALEARRQAFTATTFEPLEMVKPPLDEVA